MSQKPRSSTVHVRAIVAALLALGLVLGIAALAWAAPGLTIDTGPAGPTGDDTPFWTFTADPGTTVACSVDQGTADFGPCTSDATHAAGPLADGDWHFRVQATDGDAQTTVQEVAFTVDTAAPFVSVTSGPPEPTNNAVPTFGFAAEAGASVVCSVDQGAASWGPCTGASSHTVLATLPDGRYTFRVRATDAARNDATATRSFTVDTAPPSLSIGSGPPALTNDNTPSFGFAAEGGATVQCSVDQGAAAWGPCTSGSGHTASTLADGAYTFRVRATDAAGNEALATRSFTVDRTPPAIDSISGPAGATNDATPTFRFRTEDLATLQCSIDHGSAVWTSCTSATSHTAGATLADGDYVFRVRATDAAGNQTTVTQAFSVDSAAPSLSIDSGPPEPTNDTTPSFGFTAAAGATLECSVDQGTPAYEPCTSATTHDVGTPLVEGRYTFRVRATDAARNDAIVSRTFTIDTTPPALSIGFGPSGTTNDNTPLFGFAAEAGATVACSIDQGTPAYGPCTTATSHAATAPLADGAYAFHVRATDAAGNETTVTRTFTVDTAPPAPVDPRTTPTTPATTATTPTPVKLRLMSPFPLVRISGTLTRTGARVTLLSVRASRGALVRIAVTPPCSGRRRSSRRCRVVQAAGTVGRKDVLGFRSVARSYRSGTVIVVRVWSPDRIGKYTRFTIVRGKSPRRVDQCLVPGATRGSRCPSA